MYESHFGLRRRPFRAVPDTDSYYAATTHEQSLAHLLAAVDADEGLALLTGGPGTGKTVVGHCLLERLGNKVTTGFLIHSHFGAPSGLIRAILHDLGLPHERGTEQELRIELLGFLLKNYEEGRRTVVIVDEAQRLTPELLEELRLFTNYEGERGKVLQAILLAQPSFLQLLKLPDLAVLDQRLSVRIQLEPLGLHEAADYLVHGLRAEGGRPERIITDEALEILARATGGVPRLLNRAAHQAFQLAHSAQVTQVDVEAVLEALGELGIGQGAAAGSELPGLTNPLQARQVDSAEAEAADEAVLCMEDAVVEEDQRARPQLDAGPKPRLVASPRRPA
jgi:general secretion pathway protein A